MSVFVLRMPSLIFRVSFIVLAPEGWGRAGGWKYAFGVQNFWGLWVRAHTLRILKGKVVFTVVLDSEANQSS